jgi:hypothetical protein
MGAQALPREGGDDVVRRWRKWKKYAEALEGRCLELRSWDAMAPSMHNPEVRMGSSGGMALAADEERRYHERLKRLAGL